MTNATQTLMTHTLLDVSSSRAGGSTMPGARIAGDRIEALYVFIEPASARCPQIPNTTTSESSSRFAKQIGVRS
jgi:hypothetical protein